jgi:hypothetical protein
MQIIKGGYSFVEFDTVATFTNPKRIDQLLKAGTGFTPKTPTEEFADNTLGAAGKSLDLTIRSADVDDAVGSPYTLLKAYEEARTPLYFRFVRILGGSIVLHDCDSIWDILTIATVVNDSDAVDKKVGTHSAKFLAVTYVGNSNFAGQYMPGEPDLTPFKAIVCWVKTSAAKPAGELSLQIVNSDAFPPALAAMLFPALAAGVWTECILVFPDPSLLATADALMLHTAGLAGGEVVRIDDVRALTGYVSIVNKVIPKVVFETNEAGKHNAIKIVGEGFSDTEANLLTTRF